MFNHSAPISLTDNINTRSPIFLSKNQIDRLIDQYLTIQQLQTHLEDLPAQIANPQARSWQTIAWHKITREQIIGIKPETFLAIIVGALNTEAPIRGYTKTSRKYLELVNPQIARFVGGTVDRDGKILELGLWEKEERQHTPALVKIYFQLTGTKITIEAHTAKSYQPSDDPYEALYHHGWHRIITEYSAVCLYLWLMAHTTGELRAVLGEILEDEINHTIKFTGLGMWLFADITPSQKILSKLLSRRRSPNNSTIKEGSLLKTFRRLMGVLDWYSWSFIDRCELIYTFIRVFGRFWTWHKKIPPNYLSKLLS
jgi:hypothetical protein